MRDFFNEDGEIGIAVGELAAISGLRPQGISSKCMARDGQRTEVQANEVNLYHEDDDFGVC